MDTEIIKQWFEKIEQQKASGKKAAAWCRENGIPYQKFLTWRKRLCTNKDLTRASFFEAEDQNKAWMEITMYGSKLTLTKKFNREAMSHLLEVLKGI